MLSDIAALQPTDLDPKGTWSQVTCTLAAIPPDQNMMYLGHPESHKKVLERDGRYYCEDGTSCDNPVRRWVGKGWMVDLGACFARKVLGVVSGSTELESLGCKVPLGRMVWVVRRAELWKVDFDGRVGREFWRALVWEASSGRVGWIG